MAKTCKLVALNLLLFLGIILFFSGAGNIFAQQLPEEIETQNNVAEEGFNDEAAGTLTIPTDPDMVRLESMMSSEELGTLYSSAFEMMNIEGAQEIIAAYLENGYSLSEIGEILKNAYFSLEDTFQAMVNELGEESLQEIVGALLEANFDSGDVFKVAINHLKQVSPDLTDQEIIETILGEEIDPDLFKGLMQEIFIEKISSVQYTIKRDLVLGMIDSGFTLEEITAALSENGFSLEQIAKIYGLADIEIGLTYDLLINVQDGQEIPDVLAALLASSYDVTSVFECLVSKLSGEYSVEEIVSIVIGEVGEDGPTEDQMSNTVVLAGVLQNNGTSIAEISEAVLAAGFNLENAATVLNGIGVELGEAFSTLLNSQGGQNAADVAIALISNGYDAHEVFALSVPELKNQGFGLTEIVSLLIGEIDPEAGATKEQMENSLLLMDVLINESDSLESIAAAFISGGMSLENTAELLKDNEVSVEDSYSALISALGGEHASVAVAMTEAGFSIETVIDLAVTDLKNLGFSTADIVSMLVGSVEENKNPNSKQLSRASILTELLVSQGDSLDDIGEALFDIGFSLNNIARVFKRANVSLEETFVVVLGIGGGQEYEVVCSSLKTGGYNAVDVFEKAVTDLRAQGNSIAEIIGILVGEIDPEQGPTSTQTNNITYLVKFLVADGVSLQEMCEAFLGIDFSLENIAKVMKRAGVSVEEIFPALMAADGGQNIVDVCTALINMGYKAHSTFEIAVGELTSQGYDVPTIINMLIGTVDPEAAASSFQKRNASELISVLLSEGSSTLAEICETFLSLGFSVDEIAYQTEKAGADILEIYTALVNANGGQDPIAVINALNEVGYEISTLFETIIPELQNQGYNLEEIITLLIGEVDPENGLTSQQLLRSSALVDALITAGESIEDICTALAAVGFSLEENAKILYSKSVNYTQAYDLLLNAYGGADVAQVALSMIQASYDIDAVLDMVIPVLEGQGHDMSEIISLLIGEVSVENGPTASQLDMAAKLVEVFTDKGEVIADIADDLFSAGITLENIATILQGINVEFEEAYTILTNLGSGQDIIAVAMALIDSGYDAQTVIIRVVTVLQETHTNAQIIDSFIGAVDPEAGPTKDQEKYASLLVKQFKEAGATLESICNDLATAGFTLETIAPVLNTAEISAEEVFDLYIESGSDALDLALILVDSGYASDEVFVLLVSELTEQGETVDAIIEMVIGEIDSEDGLSSTQLGFARDLTKALHETGTSLTEIATGFFNHGLTLDQTVSAFKLAEIGLEETYTTLLAAYQPEGDEVVNRVVSAAMISKGYDSFDLYSFAVEKLADEGITDKAEVVRILIGEIDPDDSQQLSNASELSKVINYNKDQLNADNTLESFVDLFKNGYTFEQIGEMLLDKGFTQDEIDLTFSENFQDIVKELSKTGKSAGEIVWLLINQDNKEEYIRPLAEQLIRNDFSSWVVKSSFYAMPGGMYASDIDLIYAGIADAADYLLIETSEADTVNSMLTDGYTLSEISEHFAAEGHNMSFIAKLFKMLGQSMEEIFIALEETKAAYSSDLLVNDTAAIIVLLDYYSERDLFAVATQYYKEQGLTAEEIILKLMSAQVNVDSTSVLADTIIGEYYKSITQLQPQSFVTLMHAGFSVVWIKDTLMEKGLAEDDIEAFIQNSDNFAQIYQGLRDVRISASNIVNYFRVEESPGEYTVLLAENMIKDEISEEEVRQILLGYNADPDLIEEGILRGLA